MREDATPFYKCAQAGDAKAIQGPLPSSANQSVLVPIPQYSYGILEMIFVIENAKNSHRYFSAL